MANRRHHHHDIDNQNEPSWPELDEAIGELLEHPNELFPGQRRTPEGRPTDEMTDEDQNSQA
jgi:hypothetical protein